MKAGTELGRQCSSPGENGSTLYLVVTVELESGGPQTSDPLQGCVPHTDASVTSADQDPPPVLPSCIDKTISEEKVKVLCEEVASCRVVR